MARNMMSFSRDATVAVRFATAHVANMYLQDCIDPRTQRSFGGGRESISVLLIVEPVAGACLVDLEGVQCDVVAGMDAPPADLLPDAALQQLLHSGPGYDAGPGELAPYVEADVSVPDGQVEAPSLSGLLSDVVRTCLSEAGIKIF